MEVKETKEQKRSVTLMPTRMGLAEHRRRDWVVDAAEGTTVQDVLDPQYWSHVSAQMECYDRVEVRLETGEWLLELLVINIGRNWAQVNLLQRHDLVERAETLPQAQKHKIEWKGPQRKWCVIRLADSEAVQEAMASKELAREWLANHERVTG